MTLTSDLQNSFSRSKNPNQTLTKFNPCLLTSKTSNQRRKCLCFHIKQKKKKSIEEKWWDGTHYLRKGIPCRNWKTPLWRLYTVRDGCRFGSSLLLLFYFYFYFLNFISIFFSKHVALKYRRYGKMSASCSSSFSHFIYGENLINLWKTSHLSITIL